MKRKIQVGEVYKHFKGTYHRIIAIAKHSESLEELVIYTHMDTDEVWARPYSSFISLVDKEKYPNSKQTYRFELVEDYD